MLKSWDEPKKIRLTCCLVEQRRLGISCPEISSITLAELTKKRPLSNPERADTLLRYLGAKSDLLGTVVKFYELDNTKAPGTANELLAWTASREISEVVTLVEYCSEEGWIQNRTTERPGSPKIQFMN